MLEKRTFDPSVALPSVFSSILLQELTDLHKTPFTTFMPKLAPLFFMPLIISRMANEKDHSTSLRMKIRGMPFSIYTEGFALYI